MHICGRGGGDSDIFIRTQARVILWGFKILNFNTFWVFGKLKLLGMKILWILFGGPSLNWTLFKVHFYCILGSLLKARYRMGNTFFGCLNFK